MNFYNSLLELVGKTPIVKLNKMMNENKIEANIFAKLESYNPLSSVKDRAALSMIEKAESENLLNSDTHIIEPTSGNTGIGLAFVSAVKGYKLTLVMPETMSVERRQLMKSLGANLVLTEGSKGMKGAIEKATEMVEQESNSFMPQQFENEANVDAHRKNTAEEIWNDLDGKIDIFVAGVGTGGTITGVGSVLKERNPNIKIIAVEPNTSAVLSGEGPGPHGIQGIGAGFVPKILNTDLIDEIIRVETEDAIKTSKEVAKTEGTLVGISSGAALYATLQVANREENKGKNIVTVFPDTGERYLSTALGE